GTSTIAWSPDGKRVAIAITPGPWTVLSAQPDGSWSAKSYELPGDQPYGLLGFSANGRYLYGYATQGEADFWDGPPLRVDLWTGAHTPRGSSASGTGSRSWRWSPTIGPSARRASTRPSSSASPTARARCSSLERPPCSPTGCTQAAGCQRLAADAR